MRRHHWSRSKPFTVLATFAAVLLSSAAMAAALPPSSVDSLRAEFAALPLSFELNEGQSAEPVKFLARADGYLLFLTADEAVMGLPNGGAVRMHLKGANPAPLIEGLDRMVGRSNYFRGSDAGQWHTDIPTYARVRYAQVYSGIDMIYYGTRGQLEYDFVLAADADPDQIRLAFSGINNMRITGNGDVHLGAGAGAIQLKKPYAYQVIAGARREVSAKYTATAGGIGLEIGRYDRSATLIIDPLLVYSTYLGGTEFDQSYAVAVDSTGSAYVTGRTASIDFPTTAGALHPTYSGNDAFIAKLNPAGTALVYSTYLHGASGNGIAVDSAGNAYVTGEASTLNFPTTSGAFQTPPYDFDVFVSKLNPSGSSLVYSSRFGSEFADFGRGIAIDAAGNAYVTGWTVCRAPTCTFPTVNAIQPSYGGGNNDAFVSKLNSSGSALVYSTYLGGGSVLNATDDWGQAIAVDSSGHAYVTGYTYSPDFPVTANAYDTTRCGLDAFLTKFSPSGTSLVYSTFLGGCAREQGQGVAVDASGNAYVTGLTESEDNPFTTELEGFPVTPGAFQQIGSFDSFVTKFNPQGSALLYSTYLGGTAGVDRGWGIAIDHAGNAYVVGDTSSNNFPTVSAVQANYGGGSGDAFITKLNASGSSLVYSSYLGGALSDEGRGVAVNLSGEAFATGSASSYDFPTTNSFQPANAGGTNSHEDAFVVKLGSSGPPAPVPGLASLYLKPTSVTGAAVISGSIRLSAPAPSGGLVVALSSSNPAGSVAASVTFAEGVTSKTFAVSTASVAVRTFFSVSATYAGITKSATVTILPAGRRILLPPRSQQTP